MNIERAFFERPNFKDGHLVYGTTDPFTMDFSDIMNDFYTLKQNKTAWSQNFERFKFFWDLHIENPWKSDSAMSKFMKIMESKDDGMTDVHNKHDIEYEWNLAYSQI